MESNFIVFCGEISSIYHTEKNNHIILRVSDGMNHVSFFITDTKIKETFDYIVGERICLSGNIQSHSDSVNGKRFPPAIFVTSIWRSAYEWGFNKFFVSGKIVRIILNESCCTVILKTKNKYVSFIPITFYYKTDEILSLEPGMLISVSGKVQINKKKTEKGIRYYQNYVGFSNMLKKIG